MRFLLVYGHSDEQVSADRLHELVEQEGVHAAEQYGAGFLLEVWSRGDGPGICAILEADDEDAARTALQAFPMKAAGISEVQELIPLKPYAGFARTG